MIEYQRQLKKIKLQLPINQAISKKLKYFSVGIFYQ